MARLLRECTFDPNAPGPMKVIADVDNEEYYRGKIIELIHLIGYDSNRQDEIYKSIIQLALLLRVKHQQKMEKAR